MNRSNQLPNLEKLFKDDDEQDFAPLGGSNLAAIFGTSNKSTESNTSVKASKKLSAPKNISQPSSSSQTEVILAKVVHAYKLQSGEYKLVGKLGIALTANTSSQSYLLILYKNNREHISVLTLTAKFKFLIQENNYVSYYDGYNDNWSILFDSSESCMDFAREVGVSKYLLQQEKNDDSIFFQDLTVSSKENQAKEGDNIHLKYSIITHITQPLKVSAIPVQDMVVQISTDDNWERSLLDVTKGLKRILFLPPSKQISLGPGFPRERDIALEIEIIDIIPVDVKKSPTSRSRASSGKASLIFRMAKMGQSILPQKPTSTTDSEDTEEESHIKSPRRVRNSSTEASPKAFTDVYTSSSESQESSVKVPTNVAVQRTLIPSSANPNSHGTLIPAGAFTPSWPAAPIPQQYMSTPDGQLYSFPASVQSAIDPNINILLAETRTHNAEIRMGMSKIADNVQKLLDKFHVLELQNATSPSNEKALETSLKMLLALNSTRSNETVHEAVSSEANSNTKDDLHTEKIKSLEDALRITKNSLEDSLEKLRQAETVKKDFDKEKIELKEKVQKLESSLYETHEKLLMSSIDIKTANDNFIECQKNNAKLEAKIITLEVENKSLRLITNSKDKTSIHEDREKSAEVKKIMNKMYQTLIAKFTEDSYQVDYIKTTIANTIRAITLQCLKEKNHSVEQLSDDMETKNTKADETSTTENSKPDDEADGSIFLPALDKSFNMEAGIVDGPEPPPIPPIDLNGEVEWLS